MRWLGRFRSKPAGSTPPHDDQQAAVIAEPSPDSGESDKEEKQAIAEAIAALFQTPSWDDTYAYLEQHTDLLLNEVALRYLDTYIAARAAEGQSEQAIEIGRYRDLLADARTRGVPAAWTSFQEGQQARKEEIAARGPLVIGWLSAPTSRDGRRFLEAHLELLQPQTDDVFVNLINQYHDQAAEASVLRQHLALLQEIRRRGGDVEAIRTAYVNNNGGLVLELPEWLAELETESDELENQGAATAATRTDLWRSALHRVASESQESQDAQAPEILAGIRVNLYAALYYAPNHGTALEEGIPALEGALPIYTAERYPLQWAILESNLGTALMERAGGTRAENLEAAIAALSAATRVLTKASAPLQWAQSQNTLGSAYRERARGERAENLETAIACHTSALQVFTPDTFPVQWVLTQNYLGIIAVDRVLGNHADNVEQAITYYQAALTVATPEAHPAEWAQTQNNLGIAYRNRIAGDPAENLEAAIACYEAALTVRTREADPENWAQTQNNLGKALAERIRGSHSDNLERAITCLTEHWK